MDGSARNPTWVASNSPILRLAGGLVNRVFLSAAREKPDLEYDESWPVPKLTGRVSAPSIPANR